MTGFLADYMLCLAHPCNISLIKAFVNKKMLSMKKEIHANRMILFHDLSKPKAMNRYQADTVALIDV
jgi:hypothetical protein